MFITFEGLDFCGKSTQVQLLEKYLVENGKKVKIIREPGGTPISEKIRDILLDKNNSEMSIETELILFAGSRSQLVNQVILPALKNDYYVISDRFHDSSIAYQSFGRKISLDFVEELQRFVIGKAVPDIIFGAKVFCRRGRHPHGAPHQDRQAHRGHDWGHRAGGVHARGRLASGPKGHDLQGR